MSDEKPMAKPVRTWGPMALWSAAIVLALGLCWFIGAVVVPVHNTHKVVREFRSRCSGGQGANEAKVEAAITKLGGEESASRRLGLYLGLPRMAYDEDLRYYAVRLAAGCGKSAMRLLENELRSKGSMERATAAAGLSRIGPAASGAVPALEKATLDPEAEVRIAAAYALAKTDPGNKNVMPILVEVLSSGNTLERFDAAWYLYRLGPEAKASVPALEKALKDEDEGVRYTAAEALKKIRGEGQ